MRVDIEPIATAEASVARLDACAASFIWLHLPGAPFDEQVASRLARFLLDHPDYAAAGPRVVNSAGDTVATWSEVGHGDGLLSRLDRRLRGLASAPLASRDAAVLSCAALVVDREELIATLEDAGSTTAEHPLCRRLAERFTGDARRLRYCADVELQWDTSATAAADLEADAT